MSGPSRWKCLCAYDGSPFTGWQSQAGGKSVQDVIEARLKSLFGIPVRIHGSGRTDAGVHAMGQVFHFDAAWRHSPQKLLSALRAELHPAIQVRSLAAVSPTFHSRFSATGKRYTYRIHIGDADPFTRPYAWVLFKELDLAAMQTAAVLLKGRHDFRPFSAENGKANANTVRTLRRLDLSKRGRSLTITAEADGFLYKMVRSLVGTLVSVGEGRMSVGQVRSILKSGGRVPAVQTAPPQGLVLKQVFYGPRNSVA
jgi:tRNA pseudouridine38-40 synthase